MPASLRNWSVSVPNPYAAPEVRGRPTAKGELGHDHREWVEGNIISTSMIVSFEGRRFTTSSGSVYLLEGPPHPGWVEHMQREQIEIDLENPLKGWG